MRIEHPTDSNVEEGDSLLLLYTTGVDLILPITRIDENRFYADREDIPHKEHSVTHDRAIVLRKNGRYLLGKDIGI